MTGTSAVQLPLIHCVESDDVYLRQRPDVLWFTVLAEVDWASDFRDVAAQYYEALWEFNATQARAAAARRAARPDPNPETKAEATVRLLFERSTMRDDAPMLAAPPPEELPLVHVNPATIRPGVVPVRLAGRRPKCFFGMFKAFVGVALKGRAPEPGVVFEELRDNPSFARACGFTLPDPVVGYRASDIPGLRKFEQFDQIMTARGLWDLAAVKQVNANLEAKLVTVESTLVHDTTHYLAASALTTVVVPEEPAADQPAEKRSPEQATESSVEGEPRSPAQESPARPKKNKSKARTKAKKKRRKSQARTTKNCRCEDRTKCPHPWVSADSGAGTVVKAGRKQHWAQKASTLAFAGQEGVLLDAVAMTDAASHDSKSLLPHLDRVLERHPALEGTITRVLDDRAADDAGLKAAIAERHSIQVLAPLNPRGRKPITTDLPRGVDHLTNLGVPVCRAGYPFDFLCSRSADERFLFRAPNLPNDAAGDTSGALFDTARPVCDGCPFKPECCRDGAARRHVSLPHSRLPWIDPERPQISVSFQKQMARRTVIERLHKLMKYDFGDDSLTRRGTEAFQARLDKTKLAMHLVLSLERPSSS